MVLALPRRAPATRCTADLVGAPCVTQIAQKDMRPGEELSVFYNNFCTEKMRSLYG